ncbi:hypothetical protein L195_g045716 [Trifolium pratense]|uniref:Uncharacterized protein n=1 Tax=Trifolium pratense TaxID=57577 RepID=A0A2K3MFN8_TRIPR|nr:hypothetical protein L195_g045716 [Trifolium pratense]
MAPSDLSRAPLHTLSSWFLKHLSPVSREVFDTDLSHLDVHVATDVLVASAICVY